MGFSGSFCKPSLAELQLVYSFDYSFLVRFQRGWFRLLAVSILEFVKFPIEAMLGEQLLMRALFPNLAMMQDDDAVGALNR